MVSDDKAVEVLAGPPCHTTKAATVLLDEYAIEVATCCGRTFEAHDETVTDHVIRSRRAWNAQLHDLVDNIERQVRADIRAKVEGLPQHHCVPCVSSPGDHGNVERDAVLNLLGADDEQP